MNISNNISSIQAHQTMMNRSASNVANVNTDGFIPTDTKIDNTNKSITANLSKTTDTGSTKSQTDLAKEIPSQIIAQDTVALNASLIKTQDDILGSLLDIKA
jgi:flagellar hook protein FlgE